MVQQERETIQTWKIITARNALEEVDKRVAAAFAEEVEQRVAAAFATEQSVLMETILAVVAVAEALQEYHSNLYYRCCKTNLTISSLPGSTQAPKKKRHQSMN